MLAVIKCSYQVSNYDFAKVMIQLRILYH